MTGKANNLRQSRRHERRPVPLLVQYRFSAIGVFHTDYAMNISAGGILLHMVSAPQLGATVFLHFIQRGGSLTLQCRGRVSRVEDSDRKEAPVRAAVQFVDLDEDDLRSISALVKRAAEADKKASNRKPAVR